VRKAAFPNHSTYSTSRDGIVLLLPGLSSSAQICEGDLHLETLFCTVLKPARNCYNSANRHSALAYQLFISPGRFSMRRRSFLLVLLVVGVLVLAACAGKNEDQAPKAVELYLQALVKEDADQLATLSCKDWEADALMEVDSFQGVSATLDGLSCSQVGEEGEAVYVECQGTIKATYGNEQQEIPLAGRTYKVVQESGEWLMCGYK
jgi:hypothetical protein